jgi:hypothetical protein
MCRDGWIAAVGGDPAFRPLLTQGRPSESPLSCSEDGHRLRSSDDGRLTVSAEIKFAAPIRSWPSRPQVEREAEGTHGCRRIAGPAPRKERRRRTRVGLRRGMGTRRVKPYRISRSQWPRWVASCRTASRCGSAQSGRRDGCAAKRRGSCRHIHSSMA